MAWKAWLGSGRSKVRVSKLCARSETRQETEETDPCATTRLGAQDDQLQKSNERKKGAEQELSSWENIGSDVETEDEEKHVMPTEKPEGSITQSPCDVLESSKTGLGSNGNHQPREEDVDSDGDCDCLSTEPDDEDGERIHTEPVRGLQRKTSSSGTGSLEAIFHGRYAAELRRDETTTAKMDESNQVKTVKQEPGGYTQTGQAWSESHTSTYEDDVKRALAAWVAESNRLKEWKAEFDASLRGLQAYQIQEECANVENNRYSLAEVYEDDGAQGPRTSRPAVSSSFQEKQGSGKGEWQLTRDSWQQGATTIEQEKHGAGASESRLCSGREGGFNNTNSQSWHRLELERDRAGAEHRTQDAKIWTDREPPDPAWRHLDERRGEERDGQEDELPWQGSLESWRNLEKIKEMHIEQQLESSACDDGERRDWQAILTSWRDRDYREEEEMETSVCANRERQAELVDSVESWRDSERLREREREAEFEAGLCEEGDKDADWQIALDSWRQAESKMEVTDRQQGFHERQGDLDWRCFWEMWLAADRKRETERQRRFETRLGEARHCAWYSFVESWLSRDTSRQPRL